MARQLISKRTLVITTLSLLPILWYYRCIFFHKELDMTDVVMMEKSYMGEDKRVGRGVWVHKSPFMYIGVKNICKETPSQYEDFLPKVAAQIADTIREETTFYFIMYDEKTAFNVRYWPPYELEEEVPNRLFLREHWECGKKPEFTYWYIPALKHLNTEVPDFPIPLEDIQIEQAK